MVQYINCAKCWKQIEKKCNRLYCIRCRNIIDHEIASLYREKHREEIKVKNRERARQKRSSQIEKESDY